MNELKMKELKRELSEMKTSIIQMEQVRSKVLCTVLCLFMLCHIHFNVDVKHLNE